MAFGQLNPLLGSLDHRVGIHDGYLQLDASGEIVTHNIKGVSVTHPGNGLYTFTFDKPGCVVKAAFCQVVASTAVDLVAQVKSFTNTAVTVHLLAGATVTEPSAACGLSFFAISTESTL